LHRSLVSFLIAILTTHKKSLSFPIFYVLNFAHPLNVDEANMPMTGCSNPPTAFTYAEKQSQCHGKTNAI